jgi:hypothetical protein
LVGTHNLSHLSLLDQGLEGWKVSLPEVTLRQTLNVEFMTVPFRTAMYCEVLGASEELSVVYS